MFKILLLSLFVVFFIIITVIIILKLKSNTVIPLHVYQTWESEKLPTYMYNAVKLLKKTNPEFTFHLYNEYDRRKFIMNNYNDNILNAYDKLIPGAFKADLWRYCILYKYGGIYIDIKYIPVNDFKLINLCNEERFVMDIENNYCENGVANGLMICKPKNEFIYNALIQLLYNVENEYYGYHPLCVTGPLMLKDFIKSNITISHVYIPELGIRGFKYNNKYILNEYPEYRDELYNYNNTNYGKLWYEKKIYKS
jgi:mannosyltransferase OCH1-like enzyme